MIKSKVSIEETEEGIALNIQGRGKGDVSALEVLHSKVIDWHIKKAADQLQELASNTNSFREFVAGVEVITGENLTEMMDNCSDPSCPVHGKDADPNSFVSIGQRISELDAPPFVKQTLTEILNIAQAAKTVSEEPPLAEAARSAGLPTV